MIIDMYYNIFSVYIYYNLNVNFNVLITSIKSSVSPYCFTSAVVVENIFISCIEDCHHIENALSYLSTFFLKLGRGNTVKKKYTMKCWLTKILRKKTHSNMPFICILLNCTSSGIFIETYT
jgi:hypothetical protein